ncbi:MAG: diphosphomevalonate decarboxylase [Saprospiraceae bacterium]|jgi:diphosphomevalonate decarboxylase
MSYPFEIYNKSTSVIKEGKVGWKCPSNIAIVKYWGKHGRQLPKNASLSFTLTNAHTDTFISYSENNKGKLSLSFLFEGKLNNAFEEKIINFLDSVVEFYPVLNRLHLDISSSNSFPHSSGIASSASAMAAIAMCICEIDQNISGNGNSQIDLKKASYLARLGSGSASRSVIPLLGAWGVHDKVNGSSDLFAVDIDEVHDVFKSFHDDILIVSAAEKSVSSTAGHALMNGNVYSEARYQQANDRITQLKEILKTGDVEAFGKLAEDEAMTLHALMMCSDPSYVLLEPGTLDMIREIRAFRQRTGTPIYFTLDAGPNIHLLYPDHVSVEAEEFVNQILLPFTANGRVIKDKVGNGPQKLV